MDRSAIETIRTSEPRRHRRRVPALATLAVAYTASAVFAAQPTGGQSDEPAPQTLTVTTEVLPEEPGKPSIDFAPFAPKAGEHKNADELLTALETAGASIQTLTADVLYVRRMNELEGGETQTRTGMLLFRTRPTETVRDAQDKVQAPAASRREFQIDFTRLSIDDKAREDRQTFIFDGEWLVERYPELKEIHRRQVVAPGQIVDPLAIGEGPFPIPIGQKREKILDRFDACLADPADGWDASKPNWTPETYQLILTPRRGTEEARQYRLVRLWYDKKTLLPRMVRADEADESRTEVLLTNCQTNQPLPAGAFDTRLPEGWNERVDIYRPPANR